MALKLANNATTILASSISATATSIAMATADASRFPTLGEGDWFPATLVDALGNIEVVRVTARAGANLTAVRGQEGTTALAFDAGARLELRVTRGVFDAILEMITGLPSSSAMTTAINALVEDALAELTNGAPTALNQLNELAAALGNDADFSNTVLGALSKRLRLDAATTHTTAEKAQGRANLGLGSIATSNITFATTAPDNAVGNDGDLHFMYV